MTTQESERELKVFSILGLKPETGWITTWGSFDSQFLRTCEPGDAILEQIVPCVVDVEDQRLVCVDYRSREAVLSAPFVYRELREHAQTAVSIPYERLGEVRALHRQDHPNSKPLFVFTIGRCGTTLLCKLLSTVGVDVLPEPDVYTIPAVWAEREKGGDVPAPLRETLKSATCSLLNLGTSSYRAIKFRSQVNAIAPQLMADNRTASGFMMLREPTAWAKSIHRAFDWSPQETARHFSDALVTLHGCKAIGRPLSVLWYDGVRSHPAMILQSMLGSYRMDERAIGELDAVMQQDAQQDTVLAREALAGRDVEDDFVSEFQAHLKQQRQALKERGIEVLP